MVYYVLTFLKSLLLFTVILLIGTGWSLVKPYLNAREKQVVAVVLVLQVLRIEQATALGSLRQRARAQNKTTHTYTAEEFS